MKVQAGGVDVYRRNDQQWLQSFSCELHFGIIPHSTCQHKLNQS